MTERARYNPPMPMRKWFDAGEGTSIDIATVVKLVFVAGEARLYVAAGEALILTASTRDRAQIATLKEHAALGPDSHWFKIKTDAEDADSLDQRLNLTAVDKVAIVQTKSGTVAELAIGGVYAGQVLGDEVIAEVKKRLGL